MMMLIAAAIAAAQPAVPASPPATAQPPHSHEMHMAQGGDHKAMDCCKDCCKDMEKGHSGQDMDRMQDHQQHSGH